MNLIWMCRANGKFAMIFFSLSEVDSVQAEQSEAKPRKSGNFMMRLCWADREKESILKWQLDVTWLVQLNCDVRKVVECLIFLSLTFCSHVKHLIWAMDFIAANQMKIYRVFGRCCCLCSFVSLLMCFIVCKMVPFSLSDTPEIHQKNFILRLRNKLAKCVFSLSPDILS